LYEIDMGQMAPLGQLPVNTHSAQLSIYADQISQWSVANYLDLTAYAVINPNYEEGGATWNSAATGFNWTAAGMQSGTDYIATPLDTVRVMSTFTGGWLDFDVSGAMTTMNGTVTIVIMGATNAGHMLIDVKSSESVSSDKPMLHFNYTLVDSISLSGPSTTTADVDVQFSGSLLDATGNTLAGDVIWSCSDGTIDASGHFTPDQSGVVTISAAYGQVIESVNITVTAGSPVQLVIVPLAITMTADDTFTLSQIKVIDWNGNEVPGQTINIEISNGTLSTGLTLTTPISTDVTWTPWTAGQQYLNATWSFQPTISIPITVNVGAPNYFEIVSAPSIEAGNSTNFAINVFDQRGNQMDSSLGGVLTWSAENGVIDNLGLFSGDQVGNWNVTVDSDLTISSTTSIEVTYGDIADLEVTAVGPTNTIIVTSAGTLENVLLTADDVVDFTVVRIDIQGNRETVILPPSAWISYDGTLQFGTVTTWDASGKGSSWVKATLEGLDVTIPMNVLEGLPVSIEAQPPNNDPANLVLISGGFEGTVSARVSDADGNQWYVSATAWTAADSQADAWLTPEGIDARFDPQIVGDWTINVRYEFNVPGVGTQQVTNSVTFTVLPGSLYDITLAEDIQISADDTFDLTPDARDEAGNDLPEENLQWFIFDSASAPASCSSAIPGWTNISTEMQDSNYVWDATTVGVYTICAAGDAGQGVYSMSTVNVTYGGVASIWHKAYSTGDESTTPVVQGSTVITADEDVDPKVEIWVADADGNEYQTDLITWSSTSADFSATDIYDAHPNQFVEIGNYKFGGKVAQTYQLSYSSGSSSGTWNVTVNYGALSKITAYVNTPGTITLNVEQQSAITFMIEGFDVANNPVPLTNEIEITIPEDSDNLNRVISVSETSAEIYMLNEGVNSVTICSGSSVCDDPLIIRVDSTISGFFESNSPWSWVGLSALVALLLGVMALVVVLARRGNEDEEYDDDLFEDEEYDIPAKAPSVPESYSEPEPQGDYDVAADDSADGITVDEDGTKWYEDDAGTWWCLEPGMEDIPDNWFEWTE